MIPTIRNDSKPSRKTTMNACSIRDRTPGIDENDSHFQGRRQEMQQLIPRIYSGLSGMAIERHICATGLPSLPRPSFGFLQWRPMMSTNGLILTTTPGSYD